MIRMTDVDSSVLAGVSPEGTLAHIVCGKG
jgi:hypothetical protein